MGTCEIVRTIRLQSIFLFLWRLFPPFLLIGALYPICQQDPFARSVSSPLLPLYFFFSLSFFRWPLSHGSILSLLYLSLFCFQKDYKCSLNYVEGILCHTASLHSSWAPFLDDDGCVMCFLYFLFIYFAFSSCLPSNIVIIKDK